MYVNVLYINTECLNDVYITKHTFTHLWEVKPSRLWNHLISLILHIQHLLLRGSATFYVLFRWGICWKRVNLEGEIVNLTSLTWILTNRVWTIHEAHCEYWQSFTNIVQSNCDLCDRFQEQISNCGAKPRNFEFDQLSTHDIKMRWEALIHTEIKLKLILLTFKLFADQWIQRTINETNHNNHSFKWKELRLQKMELFISIFTIKKEHWFI